MTSEHPKLFISYSWTSQEHQQWVLRLATALCESGVDVILDKWDLKEGQDAHAFMEKMVTDPDIRKVVLVCDQMYAEKADNRSGGVGTETQIISAKVYEQVDQTKFVAVIAENDDEGNPFLPTYYGSRLYIDLSNPDVYADSFDQLLRWVYDKPLHEKPPLGKTPAFLADDAAPRLETTSRYRRVLEAIRQDRAYCVGALSEYFDTFSRNLERFRITNDETEFDDKVVQSIEQFSPYRNEAIGLFLALAQYRDTQQTWDQLHRFFENLIPYLERPESSTNWQEWHSDNFRFIVHELFLYAIASLLKYDCFDAVGYLLRQHYYVASRSNRPMTSFSVFHENLQSLAHRNKRLTLQRASLRADFLRKRSKMSGIRFGEIMQADFILFIRDCLDALRPDRYQAWHPHTLIYAEREQRGPFELFARSQSSEYFKRAQPIFGIQSKDDLMPIMQAFTNGRLRIPEWPFATFNPAQLMAYQKLATLP